MKCSTSASKRKTKRTSAINEMTAFEVVADANGGAVQTIESDFQAKMLTVKRRCEPSHRHRSRCR